MVEIWKDIPGFEELYQVSNKGNVKSLDRYVQCKNSVKFYKGKLLSQCIDDHGYSRVLLSKSGKHKSCLVHRLVAKAFIDNPENLPEVNHKDENPLNNNIENLEWCSKVYNLEYGTGRLRSMQSQHRKKVVQLDLNGNAIAEYGSVNDAARAIGKPKDATAITKCCTGKYQTAHGYIWKYKEVL